ncbi:MAG TPA: carbohydrate binding family 9 domain-containing protein, partial [Gammaproteobacteria bacterium]|nr:carbohydrate binding family 9 domain-containing protein [Gammaproteobacteria bacterium]
MVGGSRHAITLLASLSAIACAGEAAAQTIAATTQSSVADDAATTKTLTIVRLAGVAKIDGLLDEPTWASATLVTDLHQIDPVEYAPPSQRSEIRLYYDDDALYVSARFWDTEADRITAQVLRQGEGMAGEDRFSVILDPYLDRRNGYRFQVNPNGVRWEALYQDTSSLESNWDGIWLGAATRDDDGWTAEMAIPFKTLSFNPNNREWGINFERTI